MSEKFYLVMSLHQIRDLLALAEESERVHGNGDKHCICLRHLQAAPNFPDQISTCSLEHSMDEERKQIGLDAQRRHDRAMMKRVRSSSYTAALKGAN